MSREDNVDEMAFVMLEFVMHATNGQLSSTVLVLVIEKKYADAVEYCDKACSAAKNAAHFTIQRRCAVRTWNV